MDFYFVDKDYVSYLKQFDSSVENVNYGDAFKPHLGIVFEVNDSSYYVPISSPKKKHVRMHNNTDFIKVIDVNDNLLAVLNLNNMIPVPESCLEKLDFRTIDRFRKFRSQKEKDQYIHLLELELDAIERIDSVLDISSRAARLYSLKKNHPNSRISRRCCDFSLLEQASRSYT